MISKIESNNCHLNEVRYQDVIDTFENSKFIMHLFSMNKSLYRFNSNKSSHYQYFIENGVNFDKNGKIKRAFVENICF